MNSQEEAMTREEAVRAIEQAIEPEAYNTYVIDPPWHERGGGKIKRGADRHYGLLRQHEIVEAVVQSPLWQPASDSHLWLWCTMNHLPDGLDLIKTLGYRYVTHACWVKAREAAVLGGRQLWQPERPGLGQYLRGAHEVLLLGVRGRLAGASKKVPSVIMAPRGKHSEKPSAAYLAIEAISPQPRAELFARGPRLSWHCWGMVDGEEQVWR